MDNRAEHRRPFSFPLGLLILLSALCGLLLSIVPLPNWANSWRPLWLVLVVIYWRSHQPDRFGLLSAWLLGISIDVLYGSVLGFHAVTLTLLAYGAHRFRRQLRLYPFWQSTLLVLCILLTYQLITLLLQLSLGGGQLYGTLFFLPIISTILLWPLIFQVLHDQVPIAQR